MGYGKVRRDRHKLACAAALLVLAMFAAPSAWAARIDRAAAAGRLVVAQVDALLPNKDQVPETDALPIDGVWTISTIGKRIRIERGRAYAVDSWLHLFALLIRADMVVMRNVARRGIGSYTADDLPLLGPAEIRLRFDGDLEVSVKGSLGPVRYTLIKQEADDPALLEMEVALLKGDGAPAPPAAPAPNPGAPHPLAICKQLGVERTTGDIVCLD